MRNAIEKGQIFEVSCGYIDDSFTVYIKSETDSSMIPVGTLKDNLCWFKETPRPNYREIKKIVYLGDYTWSLKHLTTPHTEFKSLSDELQDEILLNLISDSNRYHEHLDLPLPY